MTTNDTLLTYFDGTYLLFRSITPGSANAIRISIRALDRWHSRPVTMAELSDTLVFQWIADIEKEGRLAPRSIKGKRDDVLTVWRHAHDAGVTLQGPKRVRKIKVPRKNPTSWTQEELGMLFAAAGSLPGALSNGLPRGLYFQTLLQVAYETGLRRHDVLGLTTTQVRDDDLVVVVQHKTGLPHVAQMRPDTLVRVLQIFRPFGALREGPPSGRSVRFLTAATRSALVSRLSRASR